MAGHDGKSTAPSSSASREIFQRLLVGRRIEAEDAAAFSHLLSDKVLERRHLERLIRDLVGEMRRDHDHAVGIPQNDVAGKHRRVAASQSGH